MLALVLAPVLGRTVCVRAPFRVLATFFARAAFAVQAVMHFQLKQYASANNILEGIFENIEPVSEAVGLRVVFLLLELHSIAARGCTTAVYQSSGIHKKASGSGTPL